MTPTRRSLLAWTLIVISAVAVVAGGVSDGVHTVGVFVVAMCAMVVWKYLPLAAPLPALMALAVQLIVDGGESDRARGFLAIAAVAATLGVLRHFNLWAGKDRV